MLEVKRLALLPMILGMIPSNRTVFLLNVILLKIENFCLRHSLARVCLDFLFKIGAIK